MHPYKKNRKIGTDPNRTISLTNFIITFIVISFLFWTPFQKGLFNGRTVDFERPIFSALIWGSILLFLVGIRLFSTWKKETFSDLSSIIIWCIPVTYLVSVGSAASSYLSWNMFLIQIMYAAFFLLGLYVLRNETGANVIKIGFMASAYFIVIFGLFNWFGNKEGIYTLVKWFSVDMSSLNFYRDAVMSDSNGVRLTSVFQYANTYAAFLIAVLLCCIYLAVVSKKWYVVLAHAFMAIPIIISFFLTLSRGGIVILPVVILFVLPFLKPTRQILYSIQLIISFTLSLIILSKVTSVGIEISNQFNSALSLSGWLNLIIVSAINALLVLCLQKFLAPWLEHKAAKLNRFRMANIIFPIGLLIIGVLGVVLLFNDTGITKLLPDNIRTRIENINFQQHSVLERGTFYKDALKLVKDYPLIGAGGSAWAVLYEKYQNNPYTSREAHNFFLQYLVEVGIVGFAIFILFLVLVFYVYIKNYFRQSEEEQQQRFIFYIIGISLLIHSMIDFDLSYIYLGILLFLSLGAIISNDSITLTEKWKLSANKYRWIYPSVVIIFAVFLFFNSAQLLNANNLFRGAVAAVSEQKTVDEIFLPLDKALEITSNHPDYVMYKFDILMQAYYQTKDENYYSEAKLLLEKTLKAEPHNRQLIEREISLYTIKDQTDQALEIINREIPNFPWDITLYESNINMNVELGDKARQENNPEVRDLHWNKALATYQQVLERVKLLEQLPEGQLQGREFGLTRTMGQTLGQMEYIRGNFDAAENFFKAVITPEQLNDPTGRIIIRWYLAALKKQGKEDQDLYDKLLAADPNEGAQIEGLLNAKF